MLGFVLAPGLATESLHAQRISRESCYGTGVGLFALSVPDWRGTRVCPTGTRSNFSGALLLWGAPYPHPKRDFEKS